MPIPNPHNGYVPRAGEKVRVVGACHPRLLNQVVEVMEVGEDYCTTRHFGEDGEFRYSMGELGGLAPLGHDEQGLPLYRERPTAKLAPCLLVFGTADLSLAEALAMARDEREANPRIHGLYYGGAILPLSGYTDDGLAALFHELTQRET